MPKVSAAVDRKLDLAGAAEFHKYLTASMDRKCSRALLLRKCWTVVLLHNCSKVVRWEFQRMALAVRTPASSV